MTKKPAKSKMGRPPLAPGKRRGASMGFRPKPETRGNLEEAAKANGRSMSQEVEFRLDQSFSEETYLALLCGDPDIAAFVREFLDAKRLIEAHLEKSVWEDLETHEAMQAALRRLLKQNAPSPSSNLKKKMAAYERYAEKELKSWTDRDGILGLLSPLSNPEAGPKPILKASPVSHAHAVGRAAADVVNKDRRVKALVEVLKANPHEED